MNTIAQPEVIPLWAGSPPGSEDRTHQEQEAFSPPPNSFRTVRNVTQPTLTAFLPPPSRATGTAVVICPGGGFQVLAIDHEGIEVASWLTSRGIAAFVLKYRLMPIKKDDDEFERQIQANLTTEEKMREITRQISPLAVADGHQAIKIVRRRAPEWHLDPDRIGILGFSAGARVTAGVAFEYDVESRPNFAAPIYGALWENFTVPADAPPLFLALAHDDELAVESSLTLYRAWKAAHHPAELHIYAKGGHGFGMRKQNLPTDRWMDQFGEWLMVQGFPLSPEEDL